LKFNLLVICILLLIFTKMTTINTLNKDTIYEIQKYLQTKELILLSITCRDLRNMFKNNLNRLSLDLRLFRYKITDKCLEHLKGVHTIYLNRCHLITYKGKDILRKANPNVKIYR